jgi:DNA-directed RNA polymerase specialized sigma24 family protein
VEDGSFWNLIDNERHATWRLCRALTRSYDEASDLMSDTILAAHKSFPSLRDQGAFHWFISTIAVRIQRRKRWRSRLFVPLEDAAEASYEMTAESSYDLDHRSIFDSCLIDIGAFLSLLHVHLMNLCNFLSTFH